MAVSGCGGGGDDVGGREARDQWLGGLRLRQRGMRLPGIANTVFSVATRRAPWTDKPTPPPTVQWPTRADADQGQRDVPGGSVSGVPALTRGQPAALRRTGDAVQEGDVRLVERADQMVELVLFSEKVARERRLFAPGLCNGWRRCFTATRIPGEACKLSRFWSTGGGTTRYVTLPRTSPPAQNALPPAPLITTVAQLLLGSSQACPRCGRGGRAGNSPFRIRDLSVPAAAHVRCGRAALPT